MTFDEQYDDLALQTTVRSIIISRAKEGATIEEIRSDYFEHTGEYFPVVGFLETLYFILQIPSVILSKNKQGTWLFHIAECPKESQHVLNLVNKQKLRHRGNDAEFNINYYSLSDSTTSSYYQDNNRNYSNDSGNPSSGHNNSSSTKLTKRSCYIQSHKCANLYSHPIIGDDFMLSMAKMELKCRFTPGHKILQSGFCVSGQTISDAIKRVECAENIGPSVIINIGSVDILHGHDLLDIKRDFMALIYILESKKTLPIITTLAPLANYGHRPMLRKNLEKFNSFLRNISNNYNFYVIDLWQCMVNKFGKTLYECYQPEARHVTGSNQPHVLWNKLGRQRILKFLKNAVADF